MPTVDLIHQLKLELWTLAYSQWMDHTLFSLQWWNLIVLIAVSYYLWWTIVDKRRLTQILLFGSFIAVGRIVMDIIGNDAVLWSYDIRETPFSPSPFLHDFTLTPLALMAVYQYCHSWKVFLIWTAVVVGAISFVFFPILTAFNFVTLFNWNYFFSFIFIFGIAVAARLVLLGALSIEHNYQPASEKKDNYGLIPAMKPLNKEDDNQNNEQ